MELLRYGPGNEITKVPAPPIESHAALGDPTVADAICGRVVHHAHVITLTGRSGRKRKGLNTKS